MCACECVFLSCSAWNKHTQRKCCVWLWNWIWGLKLQERNIHESLLRILAGSEPSMLHKNRRRRKENGISLPRSWLPEYITWRCNSPMCGAWNHLWGLVAAHRGSLSTRRGVFASYSAFARCLPALSMVKWTIGLHACHLSCLTTKT